MSIASRCALAVLLVCSAQIVHAQAGLRSNAVDVSLGVGQGVGGAQYLDRDMVVAALTAAASVQPLRHGMLVVAVQASVDLLISQHDCLQAAGGVLPSCRTFPSYAAVGLLGGWAMRADQGSGARVLLGPAYVSASNDASHAGVIARVDATARMTRHLSFVFFGQGLAPLANRGEQRAVVSAGIGLRVH